MVIEPSGMPVDGFDWDDTKRSNDPAETLH
jgi:hypothetical protein